jgi:hypothetical protein
MPLLCDPGQTKFNLLDIQSGIAYYDPVMAFGIQERKAFVVGCKGCRRMIPACSMTPTLRHRSTWHRSQCNPLCDWTRRLVSVS